MDVSSYFHLISVSNLLSAALVALAMSYLRRIYRSYQFFADRGLKNPPVRFFFGNFCDTYQNTPSMLREWTRLYGKTYGYFEGHLPIIVTSDIEFINDVFLKHHSYFAARRLKPLDPQDNTSRASLVTATGKRWSNMRSIIGPSFSSIKLREMNPLLEKTTSRFVQNLTTCDLQMLVKNFTMETIWYCAFGIDIHLEQNYKESVYIEKTDGAVKTLLCFPLAGFLTTFFHEFHSVIVAFYIIVQLVLYKLRSYSIASKYLNPLFWLRESTIGIVNDRLMNEQAVDRNDFLNMLLEAYSNEELSAKKKMSIEEIKMNLAAFIMGGYDTTYLTLSYCFHHLAKYPLEQMKVIKEIDCYFPGDSNCEPDVDNIKELKQLRMFIDEVQRLNAVAANPVNRRCIHATTVRGIKIPEGITVQVDVESLHRDPALWGPVDPELFHPERFSSEHKRPPLAFMAFGGGQRQCIGMKFAYSVIQLLFVKVLRKYEIHKGEHFNESLRYRDGFVRDITDSINVELVLRRSP